MSPSTRTDEVRRITILLVEDHLIVREGLLGLLRLDPSLAVIGEADDGRQAVMLARQLRPDVVLMDIAMPLLNGLEATRQIVAENPAAKVLILTAHREEAYVENARDCGASGFLFKHTTAKTLYRVIHEIHAGQSSMDELGARSLKGRPSERLRPLKPAMHLTSREAEVLQLIAEGKANKEAARILGISMKTVEKHRANLMNKLGLHDTAGITRYAIGAGVIESSVQVTIV